MPIVQIELQFNDKGAVTGVKSLNEIATTADRAQKSVSGFESSGRILSSFGGSASDAALKIKGLAVQMLALVGAYKALQGAQSFLGRNFSFSSNIEDSKISIASVIGATNKIADAQGRALVGSEKFRASQEISAELMSQIQVLALSTTATFDDLVNGVSGIIAPATKAGIAIEKLPRFAITAAQAMAAMKVPVQQMRTEIEALLSGNINRTQDILATNLGITSEMVKSWQSQGTLVEELTKRLSIFAEAGDAVAQTWSGLRGNMADALDYLSSQTGEGFFERAKQSYRELLALMVSTDDSKLGLNENIENIVAAVRDLQDEIGSKLLDVTREFIGYIRELNKPGNIAELKRDFKDFANTVEGLWGHIKNIGTAISGIVSTSLDGWRQMPDVIKELGLVGAIAFGAKGRAALVALGVASSWLQGLFELAASGDGGADAYKEYWAKKNGASGVAPLPVPLARSSVSMGGGRPASPQKETYQLTNDIGAFGDSNKGASKVASAREQLQKIREEISALNGEATKSSNGLEQKERQIEKLGKAAGLSAGEIDALKTEYGEAFKENALQGFNKQIAQLEGNTKALRDIQLGEEVKKWSASFDELVSRGKMTTEEAATNIERLKTAMSKSVENKDAQTSLSFIKEYSQLSGDFSNNQKILLEMLDREAEVYRSTLPVSLQPYIDKWKELKALQEARDPLSGSIRGLRSYSNEAMNLAKGIESAWTNGFQGMEDALVKFTMSGKLSFSDMANSIISDLMRIAIRSSITGPLASGLGSLFSGWGASDTSSAGTSLLQSNTTYFAAQGGVFSGGNIHGLSNSIVSTPTPFSFDKLIPFAQGGVVGEKRRPEGILPLGRTPTGDLGVQLIGARGETQVFVSIQNNTGAEVSQQTRTDNNGNKRINVIIGDAAAQQVLTPGSALDKANRARFGIQPQATRR